ncbi:MAG: hypothetical protein ACQEVA_01075 [Myxococcota bacterium]
MKPTKMEVDFRKYEWDEDWIDVFSGAFERQIFVKAEDDLFAPRDMGVTYDRTTGAMLISTRVHTPDCRTFWTFLSESDVTLCAVPDHYEEFGGKLDGVQLEHPDFNAQMDGVDKYLGYGFGDGHASLGWMCAFKGAGHERLVSRRWLEWGPWLLLRGPNDLSVVLFHDPQADWRSALTQCRPGHERMGISDRGGFIQTDFVYEYGVDGRYIPEERLLRITVLDRELTQTEMLEACAVRHYNQLGEDRPVERVAYFFIDPEQARDHLHELWLRELECWTVIDGREVRLDDDYDPGEPDRPDWVGELAERFAGWDEWVVGDMSAHALED